MYTFILIIHLITCILLIFIVLLQAGKSFGLSGLMGGGSNDAIFTGAGGNMLLKKITAVLAAVFIITSISLTVATAKRTHKSLMSDIMPPAPVLPQTVETSGVTDKAQNDVTNTKNTQSQQQPVNAATK